MGFNARSSRGSMAVSAFTVANIKPSLNIDSAQRFIFGLDGFPEPLGAFKLDNIFTPVLGIPSVTNFETRNNTLSGFRWVHTTNNTDTFGSLKLQSFINAQSTGTDILLFNANGTVTFNNPVSFPSFVISSDFDMNNFKIINLANPVNAQDAATKAYVDTQAGSNSVTLNGAINGSGITGTAIPTTLNNTIITQNRDQIFSYDHSESGSGLARLILKNIFAPTNIFGANTEIRLLNNYDYYYSFSQTTFAITPSFGDFVFAAYDSIGTNYNFFTAQVVSAQPIITFPSSVLFNSEVVFSALSNVQFQSIIDMSNLGIINLANPINAQDAATKAYVDAAVDNSFGPDVSLPFNKLNFNWADSTLSGNYNLSYNLNDSLPSKAFVNDIVTDNNIILDKRYWRQSYVIFSSTPGTGTYGSYVLEFHSSQQSGNPTIIPYSIVINPTTGSKITFGVDLNIANRKIINVPDPLNTLDAANKQYVDTAISGISTSITLTGAVTGSGNTGSPITTTVTLVDPSAITGYPSNSANYLRGDGTWANFATDVTTIALTLRLDQFAIPTNSLNINNQNFNNIKAIGIGTTAGVDKTILFSNDIIDEKIIFYSLAPTATNTSSIGYSANGTTYQTPSNKTHSFSFGAGFDNVVFYHSRATFYEGSVSSGDSRKITFWEDNDNQNQVYGFGLEPIVASAFNILRFQISDVGASFNWKVGISAVSSNEVMRLTGTGFLGIGTSTPNSLLQIKNIDSNRIITLNEAANDQHQFYGFGINTLALRYQIGTTTSSHIFYAAASSVSSNEIFRVSGVGQISIGGATANSRLQFPNELVNRIITLNQTINNQHQFYGFGINANILRYQVDSITANHVFYAGTSSSTSNELFRISGNGDTLTAGTIYGRRVSGSLSMQGNATTTTVSTANTFVKVAGTTTSSNLNQMSMPQSNRITYTGTTSIVALVTCSFTATYNTGNTDEIIFAIYKNGAQIPESRISFDLNNIFGSIPTMPFNINTTTTLNTNDYVELWVTMTAATRIVTVSRYMMTVIAI